MDEKITQDQRDQLVEDATYLQDEAEALKYVIDDVPYQETPPEGRSIAEMLLLIDHAQLSYYRPILEKAVKNPRPTHLENFDHFEETFEPEEEKLANIQKLLSKLAKHRAGVINSMNNISLFDWETLIYRNEKELLLFEFIQEMIHFDRHQLKKIAELVMVYKDREQTRREIEKKRMMQNHQSNNNN